MDDFKKRYPKSELNGGQSTEPESGSGGLKPFTKVAKGFRERTFATTKLSAKFSVSMAQKLVQSRLSSLFGVSEFKQDLSQALAAADAMLQLDSAEAQDSPELSKLQNEAIEKAWQMFAEMDQLKGLMMKFGQMASYLNSQMPPEAQRVLAKLQSEASALPYDEVASVIEGELGQPVEQVFDEFETSAVAAASIGQVHFAVYLGQAVAVKVQYPGVEEAVRSDLSFVSQIKPFAAAFKKLFGAGVDVNDLIDELVDRVIEECDYVNEANNLELARATWLSDGSITIPKVHRHISSRKVLVTDFVRGQSFYEFKACAKQEELNKAAHTLYRMSFESIFRYCFFNGDPHPGNYIFLGGSKVAFLDYGCVVKFSQEFVQNWKQMAQAGIEDDFEKFKHYTRVVGFVGNEKKFDWDVQWHFYQYILLPIKENKPFQFSRAYSQYGDELLIYNNKNRMALNMPRQLLFANRLQWGLKNILIDMNAEINFHEEFKALIYGDEVPVF